MRKFTILIFILFGCNVIPPEPSDYTIEEVSVEGGEVHSVQDSVGLKLVTRGLPPTNSWKMVWEINGQDVFTQDVTGKAGTFSLTKKYKGTQPGEYIFRGCIQSKTRRICDDKRFFLQ
ncbi:hypothetical protein DFQ04_2404 [Algoriphagus boseongensis]|uniref:Uncharacterized protein n=1 Tax=Algoriphagus boseongensis TaxID=1442587 RepID=A0A4R6T5U8_9BACT|nr:hypothetical protein [Algoriphagus boseongensis]TDQ16288.1 hypothetical protein DFQ04_2404 [Algoriphagus boseongensis]